MNCWKAVVLTSALGIVAAVGVTGCGQRPKKEGQLDGKATKSTLRLEFGGADEARVGKTIVLRFAIMKKGEKKTLVDVTQLRPSEMSGAVMKWSFNSEGADDRNAFSTSGGTPIVGYSGMRMFALLTGGYREFPVTLKCGPFKTPGTLKGTVTIQSTYYQLGSSLLHTQSLVKDFTVEIRK